MEEWKTIEGFENRYKVSTHGRVAVVLYSRKHGSRLKVMKPEIDKVGYVRIQLYSRQEKKHQWFLVHRLVAAAFVHKPSENTQVNHIDGDKGNNVFRNLEWMTASGNRLHAFRTGLQEPLRGNDCPWRKLSEIDVQQIRQRVRTGESQRKIAEEYGVRQPAISRVASGVRWGHIQEGLCQR